MPNARTRFFAFALLLGLSGCGSVHWQKDGASEAENAKDVSECRKLAQGRLGTPSGIGQSAGYDPRFGPAPGPSQSDLMMQESQAVGRCMRDKGYVLVRDAK